MPLTPTPHQLDNLCLTICKARQAEAVLLIVFYPEPEPSEIVLADRTQDHDSIAVTAAKLHRAADKLDEIIAKQKEGNAPQG